MAKKLTSTSALRVVKAFRASDEAEREQVGRDIGTRPSGARDDGGVVARGQQLSLFASAAADIPLQAYLACALTGLNSTDRQVIYAISDAISEVCKSLNIQLYQPRHHTDPIAHANVSATYVFEHDKQRVLESDLVIHLSHHPSTGAGEELEFARGALLPIILVSPDDLTISRMILGIPSLLVDVRYERESIDDLTRKLEDVLLEFRPLFAERKLAFSNYHLNIVGEKVREIRTRQGLTREDVCNAAKHVTVDLLRQIEEKSDLEGNPTLIQLRELATILKTTVGELVEPNANERLLLMIKHWIEGREAARNTIREPDQKKILKAVLTRLISSLEE